MSRRFVLNIIKIITSVVAEKENFPSGHGLVRRYERIARAGMNGRQPLSKLHSGDSPAGKKMFFLAAPQQNLKGCIETVRNAVDEDRQQAAAYSFSPGANNSDDSFSSFSRVASSCLSLRERGLVEEPKGDDNFVFVVQLQ